MEKKSDLQFLLKPIYIRIPVAALLVLALVLALGITGWVLYDNYVFHDLFFMNLEQADIASVSVYSNHGKELTPLSEEEVEAMLPLLRKIRLREEPYKNVGTMGGRTAYRIELKNGRAFDLDLFGGDPGMYILGEDAYSIGYRDDPVASEDFENLWALEEMCSAHQAKYYPSE